MKKIICSLTFLVFLFAASAQKVVINQTPCTDKDVQMLPALYYDHTQEKYGNAVNRMKFYSAAEKTYVLKKLDEIEKNEQQSRKNFQATGCVMRVHYSESHPTYVNGVPFTAFGYSQGLYQMVCHVQQHVVKEPSEYMSVIYIDANPSLVYCFGEHDDFYVTSKSVRYDVAIDAKETSTYDKDRILRRNKIAQFITTESLTASRAFGGKQADFETLNNGTGYTDDWVRGYKDTKNQCISRNRIITRNGLPLLVPVSRKEFLEALLEYYESEKYNFEKAAAYKAKNNASQIAIIEADKAAYKNVYETKKARIANLLATQKQDWLNKPVAVTSRFAKESDYAAASNGLFDMKQFENGIQLYRYNPALFIVDPKAPFKPAYFSVQMRFEKDGDRQWSENFANNFFQHFDFDALKKMTE